MLILAGAAGDCVRTEGAEKVPERLKEEPGGSAVAWRWDGRDSDESHGSGLRDRQDGFANQETQAAGGAGTGEELGLQT